MYIFHPVRKEWVDFYCLASTNEHPNTNINWSKEQWPLDLNVAVIVHSTWKDDVDKYIALLKQVWPIDDISVELQTALLNKTKALPLAFCLKDITSYKELCIIFNLIKVLQRKNIFQFLDQIEVDKPPLDSTQDLFTFYRELGKLVKKDYMFLEELWFKRGYPAWNTSELSVHNIYAESFEQMRRACLDGFFTKHPTVEAWSVA